jgi:hypothetical protein
MDVLNFIFLNRELAKLIYTLVLVLVCIAIVLRTDKLFRLSDHQGIRYFRNAFFFYGVGFVFRYLFSISHFFVGGSRWLSYVGLIIFEYFIIMASFFLLYSLLWKKVESNAKSSLFNLRILMFHGVALIIALLGFIWQCYYFLFGSQILIFCIALVLGFIAKTEKKAGFLDLYLFVIGLNLFAWIFNLLIAWVFHWNIISMMLIYMLNVLIFLLFLFAIFSVTKK